MGEDARAAFVPAFTSLPYWLIISPCGRLHRASINRPRQPQSSRASPPPHLCLTCTSGSQQTVRGQQAEIVQHRKYSPGSSIFTKTPAGIFCSIVIKPRGWRNQWSVSHVSISFTNHAAHRRLSLLAPFSPSWRAATALFSLSPQPRSLYYTSHLFASVN